MTLPIPQSVLAQHVIALGKTRSGKSSKLRVLVENLLDRAQPVCIIDPKGDWWGLKSSADGKSAGYPIVIFGGEHADVPINEHSGAAIAELIAAGNRSCLIDLGGWMVGERTRFFIEFASHLFKLSRGHRHLVIDEVHNFAPQGKILDPNAGKMLHWANRLASEGAGKGIILLAASQRPQKVHKDFITSCETLIAGKVIYKLDRDAVKDWIDGCADATLGKEVIRELASLKKPDAWVWCPEIEFGPKRVTFPLFKTYDSFKPQEVHVERLAGWASVDLEDVKRRMGDLLATAVENDPKALRARIRELEERGARHEGAYLKRDLDAAFNKGFEAGRKGGLSEGSESMRKTLLESITATLKNTRYCFEAPAHEAPNAPSHKVGTEFQSNGDGTFTAQPYSRPAGARKGADATTAATEPVRRPSSGRNTAGEKLLAAIARYTFGVKWENACVLAGLIPGNGYFYGGKKWLIEQRYVDERADGKAVITDAGIDYLGDASTYEKLLGLGDLVAIWTKLKAPAPQILEHLARHPDDSIATASLAQVLGLKPGNGYWYAGVKALRDAGLITVESGNFSLSPFLQGVPR